MSNSFTTTPSTASPSGVYCSLADVQIEMGAFNESVAADPDNAGDQTQATAHEQAALDFADSYINSELTRANFTTPAVASLAQLRFVAAKLAAFQLYQVRGLQDKHNAFQMKFDWAVKTLRRLIRNSQVNSGSADSFTLATGQTDATPQSIAPTVDVNGVWQQTTENAPTFGWQYYGWGWGWWPGW